MKTPIFMFDCLRQKSTALKCLALTLCALLLLIVGRAQAETIEFPDKTVCVGCKAIINDGVINKVINPDTGTWSLPCKSVLKIDGVRYTTPAKSLPGAQCIQKKTRTVAHHLKKTMKTATVTNKAEEVEEEEDTPIEPSKNTHSIEFALDHKKCINCEVYTSNDYIVKIVEPKKGDWGKLPCGENVWLDTINQYQTEPCASPQKNHYTEKSTLDSVSLLLFDSLKDDYSFWQLPDSEKFKRAGELQAGFLKLTDKEKQLVLQSLAHKHTIYSMPNSDKNTAMDVATQPDSPNIFMILTSLLCLSLSAIGIVFACVKGFKILTDKWGPKRALLTILTTLLGLTCLIMLLFFPATLEKLPISQFFFLVATILLIAFAVPLWKKINNKD